MDAFMGTVLAVDLIIRQEAGCFATVKQCRFSRIRQCLRY